MIITKSLKSGCMAFTITALLLTLKMSAVQAEESRCKALCWRGNSLAKCKSFLITEFGTYYRLASLKPTRSIEDALYATIDLGWMKNISPKYAVGGTFFAGADEDIWRLGIRARVRRWLKPNLSLDFAPGVILAGAQKEENYPGFSGHLGLNLGDWVSAVTEVDVIPIERVVSAPPPNYFKFKKDTEVAWYAGVKLGSYPGTVAVVSLGVAAAVIGIIIASSGGFGLGY